jgi:Ulp1 family protease
MEDYNSKITWDVIIRLKDKEWLNDEVRRNTSTSAQVKYIHLLIIYITKIINFYLGMITSRSQDGNNNYPNVHCFSTYFYTKLLQKHKVENWTKDIDIFNKDYLIIPININNIHWCCAVINLKDKMFEYYDSLEKNNNQNTFDVSFFFFYKKILMTTF